MDLTKKILLHFFFHSTNMGPLLSAKWWGKFSGLLASSVQFQKWFFLSFLLKYSQNTWIRLKGRVFLCLRGLKIKIIIEAHTWNRELHEKLLPVNKGSKTCFRFPWQPSQTENIRCKSGLLYQWLASQTIRQWAISSRWWLVLSCLWKASYDQIV